MSLTPGEAFFAAAHFMVIAAWLCLLGEAVAACTIALPAVALYAQIAGSEL